MRLAFCYGPRVVRHEVDQVGRNCYSPGMKSAVSEKGQVTIPKTVRDGLGLRPGTLIEFRAESGRLVGTKVIPVDPFRKWRGSGRLPGKSTVDEYLARARGAGAHGG